MPADQIKRLGSTNGRSPLGDDMRGYEYGPNSGNDLTRISNYRKILSRSHIIPAYLKCTPQAKVERREKGKKEEARWKQRRDRNGREIILLFPSSWLLVAGPSRPNDVNVGTGTKYLQ
jgi:hypothetical protein